jgi:hypothetical protein
MPLNFEGLTITGCNHPRHANMVHHLLQSMMEMTGQIADLSNNGTKENFTIGEANTCWSLLAIDTHRNDLTGPQETSGHRQTSLAYCTWSGRNFLLDSRMLRPWWSSGNWIRMLVSMVRTSNHNCSFSPEYNELLPEWFDRSIILPQKQGVEPGPQSWQILDLTMPLIFQLITTQNRVCKSASKSMHGLWTEPVAFCPMWPTPT